MQTISQITELTGINTRTLRYYSSKPHFDKIKAFKRQKELLLLKRNRTDRLIQLLGRLEKGAQCMSFKEFDLSDCITALEDFLYPKILDIS